MKLIKKILFFFSLFFLYIIIRELIELYVLANSLHPTAGYFALIVILGVFIYFILIPVIRIIRMPVYQGPTTDKLKEEQIIDERLMLFKKNTFIKTLNLDFNEPTDKRELYDSIIKKLEKECNKIRTKYVSQLFYTSSISQNGFIDAILILSSSVSLIKAIFILYSGRVSNRDLINIGKKVYYSMAIGGSEGVEYATEEVVSKLASDSMKSIPFIEKILGSLADGFVNAVLLNRISYITENYCKLTYIKSGRDIYPSPKFIATATKNITSDLTDKLAVAMRKMTIDRSVDLALLAVNPIRYFFAKTFDKVSPDGEDDDPWYKSGLKEGLNIVSSPFNYVFGKLFAGYRNI